jgi:hypothetical protein
MLTIEISPTGRGDGVMKHRRHRRDSVLGRLRAKRAAAREEQTTDVAIPGYGGELVCRYRLLDPLVEGKEIGNRVQQQFPKGEQEAEQIHFALARHARSPRASASTSEEPDGGLEVLDPEGEGAMDYGDPRLAEFLGFEVRHRPRASCRCSAATARPSTCTRSSCCSGWPTRPASSNRGMLALMRAAFEEIETRRCRARRHRRRRFLRTRTRSSGCCSRRRRPGARAARSSGRTSRSPDREQGGGDARWLTTS